ncbi:MAG: GNAT family N-acetyltransferase [Pseudomonadota bacterium]
MADHLLDMARHSPPESIHALDAAGLAQPGLTFWTAREQGELLGCVALKALGNYQGELKSMRTVTRHLRRGVASALLGHLLETARDRGYEQLFLETGSMAAFAPARALYLRFGFDYCEPFADYVADPNSVFMTRHLNPPGLDLRPGSA